MKRIIIWLFGIVIVLLLLFTIQWGWQLYKGIRPAVITAPEDIVDLLHEQQAQDTEDVAAVVETPQSFVTTGPLRHPSNTSITVLAEDLQKPRDIENAPGSGVLVADSNAGVVWALDRNDKQPKKILTGLERPHGLLTRCAEECVVYVAEERMLSVYQYDQQADALVERIEILQLPQGGRHWTRTLEWLDDPEWGDTLLISIGSTCDVCTEQNPWHGSIVQLNLDTKETRLYATGLRNAVFMTTNPFTEHVWVTEMGRDNLGDNLPPDELNVLEYAADYGWPECYGKNVVDSKSPGYDPDAVYVRAPCSEPFEISSTIDIPAHSAPLGLAFLNNESWPDEWHNDLLVAYHGSWNRTEPTGYKIVRHIFDENNTYQGVEDFITGWLQSNGTALGRPVDVHVSSNGALYISDDKAGVVYKIQFESN